jgi:hypothetical protein
MSVEVELQVSPKRKLDIRQLLASTDTIRFMGADRKERTFTPNDTLGYFEFDFAFGFPVYNAYQTGLHPQVIALSYPTIEDQYLNYEHRMEANMGPKVDDRIIGHVVAASFPQMPACGKWSITSEDKTPFVSGVASFYKKAQGLKRVLGEHITGRHTWSVSMEVDWIMETSGFAVERVTGEFKATTPADFTAQGWEYVPHDQAPPELRAVFSDKKNRVVAQYKGRRVVVLMGGLENPVHFAGLALVRYGAEPPARINRLIAAHPTHPLIAATVEAQELLKEATAYFAKKCVKPPATASAQDTPPVQG